MGDIVNGLMQAPLANVLVIAGLAFVALALVGRLKDWFALPKMSRYIAGCGGLLMMLVGGALHGGERRESSDPVTDVAIIVTAATPAQPTSTGRFHIDGKYMGTLTQTHRGGGRLPIGPLSKGQHRFTIDLEFDPPFAGMETFSCSGTFTVSGPALFVPAALTNSAGALTDCALANVR